MRVTVSVIKADIGAIGGHTLPSTEVLGIVRERVEREHGKLLIDFFVCHTGDDIAIIMTHTRGKDSPDIHQLAWDAFNKATVKAKAQGLYGAGQDLLKDAFSGNVRGLGPGSAEIELDERPSEALMVLLGDKCGPGAFNLPLYLAFTDPMYSPGLMLSEGLHDGFTLHIMDMDHTEGDRVIVLNAPERLYDIAALLRDTNRYAIEAIWSRKFPDEQAVAVGTTRLRNIAGRCRHARSRRPSPSPVPRSARRGRHRRPHVHGHGRRPCRLTAPASRHHQPTPGARSRTRGGCRCARLSARRRAAPSCSRDPAAACTCASRDRSDRATGSRARPS